MTLSSAWPPATSPRAIRRWLGAALALWASAGVGDLAVRLNFERTPTVHLRWAASIDAGTRAELERRFGLADGRHESGTTWVYLLTSASTANIQALVEHAAVEDTHHLDRRTFSVSPAAPRNGPYLTTTSPWVPTALQAFSVVCLLGGLLACAVAGAPLASRAIVRIFTADDPPGLPATGAAWASVVMCGALVVLWVWYLTQLYEGAVDAAGFRVGDWLVSYSAGFTRRGLPGWPILAVTTRLGVPPEQVVLWIQAFLYALFFGLVFVIARSKRVTVWFLTFLVSPAGLLFPLYDEAVIGRKDVLFFVAFALYAWWMPRTDRWWNAVLAFLAGGATTLAHELFFFFTPYFLVFRVVQGSGSGVRRYVPELSLMAGSLIALLLVAIVGADLHGEAQCAELLRRGFDGDLCTGILQYPVTTIEGSIQETATMVRRYHYLVAYPIAAGLAALPLVPMFLLTRIDARSVVMGVLAAITFSLPIFAIALDWGRFLNVHVMAISVALALSMPPRRTPESVFGTRRSWARLAIVIAVGVYLTSWSVRHCCEDPLRPGVIGGLPLLW